MSLYKVDKINKMKNNVKNILLYTKVTSISKEVIKNYFFLSGRWVSALAPSLFISCFVRGNPRIALEASVPILLLVFSFFTIKLVIN